MQSNDEIKSNVKELYTVTHTHTHTHTFNGPFVYTVTQACKNGTDDIDLFHFNEICTKNVQ